MRIGRIGLLGMAALVAACDEPTVQEPVKYRVGGSISGLAGSLTLQLNGGESLTRGADGPFSFTSQLEDQSDFAVTLTSAPEEQDCTLQGATGKVAGADMDSVRITCATRTYALGGTVEGLTGSLVLRLDEAESLTLSQDGPFTFTAKRPRGSAYTVSVDTQPQGQRCLVSQGSGTVAGATEDISVQCHPWFVLDTFQAATVVIGQKDFADELTYQGGGAGADNLSGPWGNPVLAGGRLYVSDSGSNRILGFNGVPASNGAAAGFVLGQPGFTSTDPGNGQGGLDNPEGLSSDGTRLAVADMLNSRVLLHTSLPASTGAQPALVLGQSNFNSNGYGCGPGALSFPEDVFVGHGKVLVADSSNNRVLVWNTLPTTHGAPPDLVLGQQGLDTCTENDADGDGQKDATPGAATLWNPTGVWTDGKRLVVADSFNHRVLVWNAFPTASGTPADVVLGQQDFTSRTQATSATGMDSPYLVTGTALQLFVADHWNHRVLVWNAYPSANGAPADVVLGQRDFTSASTPGIPSASTLKQPNGVLLAWPDVVVSDYANNRLLVFQSQ